MKKFLRLFLYIVLALLALNLLIVPFLEPTLIFFPVKHMGPDPMSIGLAYDDIYFKADDQARLNGWFVRNPASDKVILLLHGNGGNISHRLDLIKILRSLPANVFIIDYHGYGYSEGEPSEKKLYLAAKGAYDYLLKQKGYRPDQIIVMGSSLGAAVAVRLAADVEVGGLIMQKSFSRLKDMAVRMNPLYRKPFIWLTSRFDNLEQIKKVVEPKLIIHSKQDEIIPYQMSLDLYQAAQQPKTLLLLEQGGHNDIYSSPEYMEALRRHIVI